MFFYWQLETNRNGGDKNHCATGIRKTRCICTGLIAQATVKRPKFGNVPLVRHPLSKLLKNHISARTGVSDLVQRGDWLYIFFWTNKKRNNWESPLILYDFQQLGHGMSKLGFEIWDNVLFFHHEGYIFWGSQSKKVVSKISLMRTVPLKTYSFCPLSSISRWCQS